MQGIKTLELHEGSPFQTLVADGHPDALRVAKLAQVRGVEASEVEDSPDGHVLHLRCDGATRDAVLRHCARFRAAEMKYGPVWLGYIAYWRLHATPTGARFEQLPVSASGFYSVFKSWLEARWFDSQSIFWGRPLHGPGPFAFSPDLEPLYQASQVYGYDFDLTDSRTAIYFAEFLTEYPTRLRAWRRFVATQGAPVESLLSSRTKQTARLVALGVSSEALT
jgi:hypothetical protein